MAHTKEVVASTTAIAAVFVVPAHAEGLLQPSMDPVPNALSVGNMNFNGFYFGAGLGLSGLDGELGAYAEDVYSSKDFVSLSDGLDFFERAFSGTVEIGYDIQHQSGFVFGFAGDLVFNFDSLGASETYDQKSNGYDTELDYFGEIKATGSLTVRAGQAVTDNTLLYVLGGLSLASYEIGGAFGDGSNGQFSWSESGITHGFTVGAGVEHVLHDNLSLKLEYRYSDFDGVSTTYESGDEYGYTEFNPGPLHQGFAKLIYRIQ